MTIEQKLGTTIWRKTPEEYRPPRSWRSWLIGRPLATADALPSTAYATQEILVILALAGTSA